MQKFKKFLKAEGKSVNTVKGYISDVGSYFKWFRDSYGKDPKKIFRQNVLDFKSFMMNVKALNAKTVNHKLSSLRKYNEFLVEQGVQKDVFIKKKDMVKIQSAFASPTKVREGEVKRFIQNILENENSRNYALVTLLAYTGLRISETLGVKLDDFDLDSKECIVRSGKGDKQRVVLLNSKVANAFREYLKERGKYSTAESSPYLFVSKKKGKLDRTVVNRFFKKYSDKITPHQLRHFFCSNAIEKGMGIHEVAYIAGHSNVHTTLIYTNPDREKLKGKMELL